MNFLRSYGLLIVAILSFYTAGAKQYTVTSVGKARLVGKYTEVLEDKSGLLTINDVISSNGFKVSEQEVPNLGITENVYWLKLDVKNQTDIPLIFHLRYALRDSVTFYKVQNGVITDSLYTGEAKPVSKRTVLHNPDFFFNLNLVNGETATYYVRIESSEQIMVPLFIGSVDNIYDNVHKADVLSGIYLGIILVMFLYNLFVFYSVRDRSYLYYVMYILFVGITQLSLQGFAYDFLWPDSPWLANQSVILFPALTGIAAIEFFKNFLQIKTPKYLLYILNALNLLYIINICLSLFGKHMLSQQLMQPTAMLASFIILGVAINRLRKGSRSAGYFILAWSVFLAGIVIFVMKEVGVLPYNDFTNYILHIGSAIEVVVLSFALADRINILRKEKDESQRQALLALEENAKIISEQNVILETKVSERTVELRESNNELNLALKELKEAEAQLVESEKMASLGQLTAGIAHEINNPINFVTSNVKPLKRDVDMIIDMLNQVEAISVDESMDSEQKKKQIKSLKEDMDFDYLKTEIDYLLNGITDGSNRTAEIVKGLRIFSRLDEDDLKMADMNEGLDSTLVIVRNTLGINIDIVREYGNIPPIECYPGKLNQVFLNIITNGLQAIREKYKDEKGGVLTIKTAYADNGVQVSIKDNGVGMDDNTKKKVFEPFFTTKAVGEGTGLGMSIVYNTINKHNGKIDFESTKGEGTEFIIKLPVTHVTRQIEDNVGQQ